MPYDEESFKIGLAVGRALWKPQKPEQQNHYLIFSSPSFFSLETNRNRKTWNGALEYSTDKINWSIWNGSKVNSVAYSGVYYLYLRGKNNTTITNNGETSFKIYGDPTWEPPPDVSCSGDIRCLLNYENIENCSVLSDSGSFRSLFAYCEALIKAPDLGLKELNNYCYTSMFSHCTNLVEPPALPAVTLGRYCYAYMFYGCTSLISSPELPAKIIPDYGYKEMFYRCTSLIKANKILGKVSNTQSLASMYEGCTALEQVQSDLYLTTLASKCCQKMYKDCSSLLNMPYLPATTTADYCYNYMFYGCSSLRVIKELPITNTASYCCQYMFYGCTSAVEGPSILAPKYTSWACYQYMFAGCSSLKAPPRILIEDSSAYCCEEMFEGCSSLEVLPLLDPSNLDLAAFAAMFYGCTKIIMSKTQTAQCPNPYRIPATKSLYGWLNSALNWIFENTGGEYPLDPYYGMYPGTVYYTANRVI